ncbi:peptidyl-tRNA hydrolase 2, mitochondrial-like isoform X1 [Zootermopsis nevadensis]|uniref:peptidyl-tRNA hydrolase n=1 Tax=Zootermopsis nevadensis TaxID=136037 RepID=A0A067R5D2_ZOONE|nr:peptidyl-tRNA hydrolase 2, mitochondrial-like isoform X1 [Zootermopsis nevadensis]KDR18489.1 Peptidyl-tRNA hydrolase 2, mitochondrial [Zootermopsis nevadensis]
MQDVKTDANMGLLSHVINSTFLSGLACGVSIAWIFLKVRSKILPKNTILSGERSSTFGEPPCDGEDNFKLVLIVRSDLKMGKGKVAAQCSHAAVAAYQQALLHQPNILEQWEESGEAKVVLKVETEQELLELASVSRSRGLITSLVRDAGRTQIAPGSKTVLGIGPGPASLVDKVSGHLKLF